MRILSWKREKLNVALMCDNEDGINFVNDSGLKNQTLYDNWEDNISVSAFGSLSTYQLNNEHGQMNNAQGQMNNNQSLPDNSDNSMPFFDNFCYEGGTNFDYTSKSIYSDKMDDQTLCLNSHADASSPIIGTKEFGVAQSIPYTSNQWHVDPVSLHDTISASWLPNFLGKIIPVPLQ